ncbi:putative metalloprotease CJM1_0395 family protein [Phytopseudomonas dryadis]|uniref:SprA-related family protein n=1 Tax=Phytopseudomonas dryadis TaxID=2487520 RepID=A0ABY1Z7K3_9GAMM|nr:MULTISPECIES: putative metalloprotease CJM1_0395 family protein [Pseudomonas]TBV04651.1 hypothetical protein DNK34_13970 [Pseudomonas dryadis]TBV17261.1 hypothetical protein DNK41_13110 [Pseudomonas sp. FRB 230]
MQIGGVPSYFPTTPTTLPAQTVESSASADIARAAFAPIAPGAPSDDPQSPSAREEADQPAERDASAASGEKPRSEQELRLEQLQIAELASRDREVRTHEQAHAAVGGVHAGAPSYTYTRGPDGKRYATAGEVSIDVGAVANDPRATLSKMQVVLRAALAPAEPSAQDRSVAAQAQAQMAVARGELAQLQRREAEEERPAAEASEKSDDPSVTSADPGATSAAQVAPADLDIYRRSAEPPEASGLIDLRA